MEEIKKTKEKSDVATGIIAVIIFLFIIVWKIADSSEDYGFENGYEHGYEVGFEEGIEFAREDDVWLDQVVEELMYIEEYEAVDSLRKIYNDEAILGEYIADSANNVIHHFDCQLVQFVLYETMDVHANYDYVLRQGFKQCNLCIQ